MSMPSSQGTPRQDDSTDLERAARPITATEATLIEEEARERAGQTAQEVMGERRRGRVEAEAHRISEEMTRRAQEQQRAAEHRPASSPRIEASDILPRQFPPPVTIRRVLVPLSGAEFAERAIPYAVALAQLTGASLAFVHIGEVPASDPGTTLMASELRTSGIFSEWPAPDVTGIERIVLPAGAVSEKLLSLEAPDGSDLVVLATRRHLGAEGDTLGTVAQALIRHGKAPVLVIAPDVVVSEREMPRFRRILVPLDGSTLAEQALAPLIRVLRGRPEAVTGSDVGAGGSLHEIVLFSVAEARQTLDDAYLYLTDISEQVQSNVPANVRCSVEARLGSAPGAIVATAAQGGEAMHEHPTPFDLVALATHGRGGLRRWLLGSVAEYVLTHATVPVLVVCPTQPEQIED